MRVKSLGFHIGVLVWLGGSLLPAQRVLKVPEQYTLIQLALAAANDGDTVLVSPGRYREFFDFKGKNVSLVSRDGPEVTVIDADGQWTVVTFSGSEDRRCRLEGFTLTHGYRGAVGYGGAIECYGSPTIVGNIIKENLNRGIGGIRVSGPQSAPLVQGNVISRNKGASAGGMEISNAAKPVVIGNVIEMNHADYGGGIVVRQGSDPHIERNYIVDNRAMIDGGGIRFHDCRPQRILNNVVAGNYCYGVGGGVSFCWNCAPVLIGNTVVNNTAERNGGGLFCPDDSHPVIVNGIHWQNGAKEGPEAWVGRYNTSRYSTLTMRNSVVKDGKLSIHVGPVSTLNWGPGMVVSDPRFVDLACGDYHLRADSPCVDQGDGTVAGLPTTDMEGDLRVAGGGVDMGCDEFAPHLYLHGTPDPDAVLRVRAIGQPGHAVILGISLNPRLLDPPASIPPFGNVYLDYPSATIPLGTIPGTGCITVDFSAPGNLPVPSTIPIQALIGNRFSNPHLVRFVSR